MIEILKALKTLGIKGQIAMKYICTDRVEVKVSGKYFGVWDIKRQTFVD